MNITQICQKYNISDAYLNSKDDGYGVAISSLTDLIQEIHVKNGDKEVGAKLEKLRNFLHDVKNMSY
jgi:hypothetical protein